MVELYGSLCPRIKVERASKRCNSSLRGGPYVERTGSADEVVRGFQGGHEPSAQPKVEKMARYRENPEPDPLHPQVYQQLAV